MSGSQSGGKGGPPPAGGAADPSMEDILASIRRILSEDDGAAEPAAAAAPTAPAAAAPAVVEEPDVFALEASMLIEPDPLPVAQEPSAVDLDDFSPPPPAPPPPLPVATPALAAPVDSAPITSATVGLVAPAAAAAAVSSLNHLVRTLAEHQSLAVYRGGPTLEDIVREEMRPMLKSWLDENLPPLVERLVRTEIERVVGRATS